MFSENAHPVRPKRTKFVIYKSENFLKIDPPSPKSYSAKERLFKGLIPLNIRVLIALSLLTVLISVQWVSYILLGFNPVMLLSLFLAPFLLGFVFSFPKTMHLYFNAEDNQFEIRLRSIEIGDRREKTYRKDTISEIQSVSLLEQYQKDYCIKRSLTIYTRQRYELDWNLTRAEGEWIVAEIQTWLLRQRQERDEPNS